MSWGSAWKLIGGLCAGVLLAGCSGTGDLEPPPEYRNNQEERIRDQAGTVWGGDRTIFQAGTGAYADQGEPADGSAVGIGVNAYLWRASLDTISFLPLAQADPFGGVIITDWYSPPESPNERFKLNVYVLDTVLRADGVRVTVFRQTDQDGAWRDAAVDPQTGTDIEDSILTRARELRVAALNASG